MQSTMRLAFEAVDTQRASPTMVQQVLRVLMQHDNRQKEKKRGRKHPRKEGTVQ